MLGFDAIPNHLRPDLDESSESSHGLITSNIVWLSMAINRSAPNRSLLQPMLRFSTKESHSVDVIWLVLWIYGSEAGISCLDESSGLDMASSPLTANITNILFLFWKTVFDYLYICKNLLTYVRIIVRSMYVEYSKNRNKFQISNFKTSRRLYVRIYISYLKIEYFLIRTVQDVRTNDAI